MHERVVVSEPCTRQASRHEAGEGDLQAVTVFARHTLAQNAVAERQHDGGARVARRPHAHAGVGASPQRVDDVLRKVDDRPNPPTRLKNEENFLFQSSNSGSQKRLRGYFLPG